MPSYDLELRKSGNRYEITVAQLGVVTFADSRAEVEIAAKDAIASWLDCDFRGIQVRVARSR